MACGDDMPVHPSLPPSCAVVGNGTRAETGDTTFMPTPIEKGDTEKGCHAVATRRDTHLGGIVATLQGMGRRGVYGTHYK